MKILNQAQYKYLEKKYQSFLKQGLLYLLIALGGIILLFAVPPLGIAVGIMFWILTQQKFKKADNYMQGIKGEEAVVNALQELDDSWWLINDAKLARRHGNIDHILLSPKGIFLIETKNYGGSVRCYGDNWIKLGKRRGRRRSRRFKIRSASRQVKFQASLLRGLLKRKLKLDVSIIPVCVLAHPEVKLQTNKPSVKVLKLKDLVGWLQRTRSKYHLTEKEMDLISRCILEKAKSLSFEERTVFEENSSLN